MHDDFVANLHLLCSYYPSIAEVCRRLPMNRTQFNRYLSGRYRPRHMAMRRICAFFGVEEHELYLPQADFCNLVQMGRIAVSQQSSDSESLAGSIGWPDELVLRGKQGMTHYLGYYFEYYYSMSRPGKIIRTLVCLESRDNGIVYQRTERTQLSSQSRPCHNRYTGVAVKLGERIFLVDHETLNGHEITQTILFPSYQSQVTRLTGLRLGVADNSERMPCCVRVLYQRLDEQITLRQALTQCGWLSADSPELDDELLQAIRNDVAPEEYHFRARH
uniref:helix-turn-helix domain-containing protein n=1 Tax=Halomonas sp. TaxID=1486246 RepID=UPI0026078B40|nr:helix-turn-helix domain-containing protein [Halomonas sp.]